MCVCVFVCVCVCVYSEFDECAESHYWSNQMVEKYILQTHGKTHSQYRLSVTNVYTVDKETEKLKFQDVGNRLLTVCLFV